MAMADPVAPAEAMRRLRAGLQDAYMQVPAHPYTDTIRLGLMRLYDECLFVEALLEADPDAVKIDPRPL
jgi:hypothetical protein